MPINIEITDTVAPDGCDVPSSNRKTAVVIDRGGNRAWSAEGPTESVAATEAVRRFLGDRRAKEYVE